MGSHFFLAVLLGKKRLTLLTIVTKHFLRPKQSYDEFLMTDDWFKNNFGGQQIYFIYSTSLLLPKDTLRAVALAHELSNSNVNYGKLP